MKLFQNKFGYEMINDNGYIKPLHRFVYESEYGEIPIGYEIHHKDGNKQNNNIENLVAIPKEEHEAIHGFKRKDFANLKKTGKKKWSLLYKNKSLVTSRNKRKLMKARDKINHNDYSIEEAKRIALMYTKNLKLYN